MEEAGLPISDRLIAQGQFTYRSGMSAAERLLAVDPPPTAIFASNDDMAAATVAMAHRRHLDVPNDITVCGFDDTELASSIWPELTTIRQPIREMTAQAVTMIARAYKAKTPASKAKGEQVTLAYKLVRRSSDAGPSLAPSFKQNTDRK
jgi:LacI family transcriptional regulator